MACCWNSNPFAVLHPPLLTSQYLSLSKSPFLSEKFHLNIFHLYITNQSLCVFLFVNHLIVSVFFFSFHVLLIISTCFLLFNQSLHSPFRMTPFFFNFNRYVQHSHFAFWNLPHFLPPHHVHRRSLAVFLISTAANRFYLFFLLLFHFSSFLSLRWDESEDSNSASTSAGSPIGFSRDGGGVGLDTLCWPMDAHPSRSLGC